MAEQQPVFTFVSEAGGRGFVSTGGRGPAGPSGPQGQSGTFSPSPTAGDIGLYVAVVDDGDGNPIFDFVAGGGVGSGTVTKVSVVTANGVSGSVATDTTTPAITLTLGAITPTSVNGVTVTGGSAPALTVTGTTSVSGTNTGDETASGILAKLVTVDGAGSGLDADLLDGLSSLAFVKADGSVQMTDNLKFTTLRGISNTAGTRLIYFSTTGIVVVGTLQPTDVEAYGFVHAAGTLQGSNFSGTHSGTSSGTNTGDQDLSSYATTAAVAAAYQPLDSDLTSITALTTTSFGRGLLTETNAGSLRTTAGLGSLATVTPTGTPDGSKFLRDDNVWTAIPGGGDALVANPLSQFAATTSSQLRGVISDETGTGVLYFQGGDAGTPSAIVLTNATGTASGLTAGTATVATTVTVADTTDTTCFLALLESATGNLGVNTDLGATYNASTGVLTATGFAGPLTGNVTGDVTGNAATVTTNANLTGHITSTGNAAVLGSFTVTQLNAALSDGDVATGGGTATGTNTGDNAVNSLYSGLVSNATHTGDATGATALTLASVNADVGSFGSATATGTFTVNAKGLVTAAGSTTVTPAVGSITGLGTGVATALAVNVGSAGSPVVNGGALGTPASGTLTNATGLPTAGLVNSAVTYAKMQDVSATDKVLGRSTAGAGVVEEISCTAAGRALIDDASAAVQRSTLGFVALTTLSTTGAVSIDCDGETANVLSLTGNVTLSLTNEADGRRFSLYVRGQASGHTITWWAGLKWTGGAAPTIPTTSGRVLPIGFLRLALGEWLGIPGTECY